MREGRVVQIESFVGLLHDQIDDVFHVVPALPSLQLAIRAGAVPQDSFDVLDLASGMGRHVTELRYEE